jgi:myosin-5
MKQGTLVWLPARGQDRAWVLAEVASDTTREIEPANVLVRVDDNVLTVAVSAVLQSNASSLFDPDEDDLKGIDDLIALRFLHEPAIMQALTVRYGAGRIYTSTGPIVIAINPFRDVTQALYTWDVLQHYKRKGDERRHGKNHTRARPHIYGTADSAYRRMRVSMADGSLNENQCILISGESGAGKTVSTKYVMQFLATMGLDDADAKAAAMLGTAAQSLKKDKASSRGVGGGAIAAVAASLPRATPGSSSQSKASRIQSRVLVSNAILEAFGNARTLRNDNSSRFGKFIKMSFDARGRLAGARIDTYLLEKSRVISQNIGERNYHCFYQLVEGATEQEREDWQLLGLDECNYTNGSECYERRDGVQDADEVRCFFFVFV